jgi:hypothetical protein
MGGGAQRESTMSDLPNKPLLTRKGLVQHINDVIGVSLKLSSFEKLAMLGDTPEPDAFYGKVELFSPETAERWARERLLSRKRAVLGVNNRHREKAA